MSESIETQIAAGQALEDAGQDQAAIDYFVALADAYPDNAIVLYETGGAFDSAGYEAEAVGYYRRALALGLPVDIQPKIAVQLGSSLRNLKQYDEAVEILSGAAAKFPDFRALKPFLALALFSAGRQAEALALMIRFTTDVPEFYERYHRSLRAYADLLVETDTP